MSLRNIKNWFTGNNDKEDAENRKLDREQQEFEAEHGVDSDNEDQIIREGSNHFKQSDVDPQPQAQQPQQAPTRPSQPQYTQPQSVSYAPVRNHHYVRDAVLGVIAIIAICVGVNWYQNRPSNVQQREPQQTSQQVQQEDKNSNAIQAQDNRIHTLQGELTQMGINQQDSQKLLQAYEGQNVNNQRQIFNKVQSINRSIPSSTVKRVVIEKLVPVVSK